MRYENNWESLNSRPVPQWFADAKFGIFIHWGLYSVPAFTKVGDYAEWYAKQLEEGKPEVKAFHERVYTQKKYEDFVGDFKAELFDADQWAKLFRKTGAKYINFVSKHHDGFCMYKSDYAWNWNSVDVGPHRDFCAELKKALEGTGVRFGVYHSVYDWYHPFYLQDPEKYALEVFIPMLKELILKYEPATLFTDGEWDHESSVWHSTDFLTWLYNDSPVRDYIVPNDRWGKETRGRLGGNFTTEYGWIQGGQRIEDITLDRPFEECRGIGGSFGLNRMEGIEDYLSTKALLVTLCDLVSKGGNFLLNIGPAADGTIPVIMEERLLQMGKWLEVNGDAIYGTKTVIKALASGREAASEIDRFLGGDGDISEKLVTTEAPSQAIGRIEGFACLARAEECFLEPDERRQDFRPISAGICDAAICGEAERCLQCDLRFGITGHRLWSDYSAEKEAAK